MLSILDRYLLKESLWNWLAVTLVLWAIVMSNSLARFLADAVDGDIPGSIIFTLLGLKSISYLTTLIPLSLFLGVLLALGRLYQDSEMAAMQACGVGTRQIYRPLLLLAALVSVLVLVLSLFVAPRTSELGFKLREAAEQKSELANISAGQFEEGREGEIIFYAEKVDQAAQQMEGIFVRSLRGDTPTLMTARNAYPWTNPDNADRFIVLEKGFRYQGVPGQTDYRIAEFDKHGLRIETASGESQLQHQLNAMATIDLWGSTNPRFQAELQWRLSLPLAALMLVLLAVPLSRSTPRQGRYSRLLLAVLVFVIYYNLLGTGQSLIERGKLPAVPGIWLAHLVPLVLAWLFWRRAQLKAPRVQPA